MKSVNEIRSCFLNYFHRNGHEILPSGSLVPHNDPTLMFTNAGMVPFKNVFTGVEKAPFPRATTAQKCVRAGGKHNDLDNVGYTARHHTFFEMLGNFSFGEYFKEEAIFFAWNLLIKEFELPPEKLLVSVYHEDETAAQLWKKIAGLPEEKIIRIATQDNFWSMGDTGPCGPCSEIFYDHGENVWGGPPGSPEEDGDRFVEIWNLVFMQYEHLASGERIALPKPSIDTGIGLERIAAVLQGVHNNYDIDLFRHLIEASEELTKVKATGEFIVSHRVVADHLRSSAFLIADGVLPSNEGRGYVLRRIMRRAMRHAQLLKAEEPLMYRLLPSLIAQMGDAYPELIRANSLIGETLHLEEIRFRKTLERGLHLLNEASKDLQENNQLCGEVAFKLYDTYGFPLDLTEDALRHRGITVDKIAFHDAMERQKKEARAHWVGSGEHATETLWFNLRDKLGASEFLGYKVEKSEAVITALLVDGQEVESLKEGDKAIIIVNQTPFYGESGGQIGDTGIIKGETSYFLVEETLKKASNVFAHIGVLSKGHMRVAENVTLEVAHEKRQKIRANHSATHILHEALRQILGEHVAQKGSLVAAERLRFDFSHNKPISQEELQAIESLANKIILQNTPVITRIMAVDDAIALGARALFGEKYGDEVRVVSLGRPLENGKGEQKPWSIELCGGTHVDRTGDIGLLSIVEESGVAAGVRRIEALTGENARQYLLERNRMVATLAETLKTSPQDLVTRVKTLNDERKKFEKELTDLKKKITLGESLSEENGVQKINGINFVGKISKEIAARDLKSLADRAKKQIHSGVVMFIALEENNKASVVIAVTEDLTSRLDAVTLIHKATSALDGKGGGGRKDMAQGGGPNGAKAEQALEAVRQALSA